MARGERGQALIEFALIAPIVVLFLFTIVDFGVAMDRRLTLQHAVREGARYAAVHTDEAGIKNRTQAQAQDLITPADVTVCYLDGPDANLTVGDPGDSVRVNASFTYDFDIVGEIAGAVVGSGAASIDISPSGTARLERTVIGGTACAPPP